MEQTSLQQRIRNWGKYNSSLVERGRVTVWIGGDATDGWYNTQGSGKRGRVKTYSDAAILCVLTIQAVYG